MFLVSFTCFGQIFGEWETGEIIDDWGDSTGQKYVITAQGGTFFRIMKDKSGDLTITIRANEFLDSDSEARTSYIRVDSNTPNELIGYTWGANGHQVIDIYSFSSSLVKEMMAGAQLRTINFDYNDVKVLDKFSLNGFTSAYKWLMQ